MTNASQLPENLRIYAIGDIHGRHDLLLRILELIKADTVGFAGKLRLVFLGDYIDRGRHSREVIEILLSLSGQGFERPVFIQGNHEMMLRQIIKQEDREAIIPWLSVGGYETCLSYNISLSQNLLLKSRASEFIGRLQRDIPATHQNFIDVTQSHISFGDYFFCHAGVRPKVALSQQSETDMAWIRDKFLKYNKPFEKIIVHGHTITEEPDVTPYRIGIDTGAYATGKLTALGLEGTRKWFLQT